MIFLFDILRGVLQKIHYYRKKNIDLQDEMSSVNQKNRVDLGFIT